MQGGHQPVKELQKDREAENLQKSDIEAERNPLRTEEDRVIMRRDYSTIVVLSKCHTNWKEALCWIQNFRLQKQTAIDLKMTIRRSIM